MYMIHNLNAPQLAYLKRHTPDAVKAELMDRYPNASGDASLVITYQDGGFSITQADPYRARYRTVAFRSGNDRGAYASTIAGSIAKARQAVKEAY